MGEYYSAREAASILKLNYHTLLARVRAKPDKYKYQVMRVGWEVLFLKEDIDSRANHNDTASEAVEETTGEVVLSSHKESHGEME